METITYVLEGALAHQDSTGASSIIRAGDAQRMSAGTGVSHSEYNPSLTEPVQFFQIWIVPNQAGWRRAKNSEQLNAAVSEEGLPELSAIDRAEVLLFDLA